MPKRNPLPINKLKHLKLTFEYFVTENFSFLAIDENSPGAFLFRIILLRHENDVWMLNVNVKWRVLHNTVAIQFMLK